MPNRSSFRQDIERRTRAVRETLFEHIGGLGPLAIVKAPPGSGKTYLLIEAIEHCYARQLRVAVACQTNAQANDVCRRLANRSRPIPTIRFASGNAEPIDLGASIVWETQARALPTGRCVVVATTAKWGLVMVDRPFDYLLVDEAWQMAWKDFMLCGQVAPRFVLIGDPGQIPPVITLDVARWETSPRPPHVAAPEVILQDGLIQCLQLELPASRRLPHDAVSLLQPFYDFPFGAYAGPGERAILAERDGRDPADTVIDLLSEGSVTGVTIPTPASGPPLEQDQEVADVIVRIVGKALRRNSRVRMNGEVRPLGLTDIGIAATHRAMNSVIDLALPSRLRGRITVDTPERWQGLQRPLMIIVHPLSGVGSPSTFDLETGRLCVMASRHQCGLVIVTRDHLPGTLRRFIPSAGQALGRPDVTGRGHEVHLGLWHSLETEGRVTAA